ncbi:tetratricopeptide repeat protein [Algicella marina]|uniref:Tetratricopeptide repeat protein n=1 Tax=Algicella marina TaxID=2683284 RepID=A0A6P1T220_9RHOB|nr:tetratricopeptide repeat protein [Algicella marina]QHQ35771.1 tetratricopeptide repeat protein [Algicella marina]
MLLPLRIFALGLAFTWIGMSVAARPLITSSEDSYGRICLESSDTPERIAAACEAALAESGALPATRAGFHRKLGSAKERLGDTAAAASAFLSAIGLLPNDVEAMNLLGWMYWDIDRNDEAVAMFRRSLSLRPTASANGGLANLLRIHLNQPEEALQRIETALLLEPEYSWGLREKGWIFFDLDRDADALEAFEAALFLDSEDAFAHYGVLTFHERAEDYEAALEAANRTIEFAPKDADFRSHRAFLLRRLDRNQQAIRAANEAIELDPRESDGYVQRAFAESALGYTAQASRTFQAGIDAGAGDRFLHYWYADHLSDYDSPETAMHQIDKAISLPGVGAEDWSLKAYLALELEDDEEALRAAISAVRADAGSPYGYYYHAVAELRLGRENEALVQFDAAMNRDLPIGFVRRFVGELLALGRFNTAMRVRRAY